MTKIQIISGFLGAGKTTYIKKLLSHYQNKNYKVALIENEYGEIAIDGTLLENQNIEVRELYAGCICCTLNENFHITLKEILQTYTPDIIIIEPTGVGKLSDIKQKLQPCVKEFELQILPSITIIDIGKAIKYLENFREFYYDQIFYSDLLIYSKHDLYTPEIIEQNAKQLQQQFPMKKHLYMEKDQLEDLLFFPSHIQVNLPNTIHSHECESITSYSLEFKNFISYSKMENFIQQLKQGTFGNVLRAKGFFVENSKQSYLFQFDGEFSSIEEYPASSNKLCIIGNALDKAKIQQFFYNL